MGPQAWRVAKDGGADVEFSSLGSGRAWEGNTLFLLLPPGNDPYTYTWTLLTHEAISGPVLICQAGEVGQSEVHRLADVLLRDGVRSVLADSTNGPIRYSAMRRAA